MSSFCHCFFVIESQFNMNGILTLLGAICVHACMCVILIVLIVFVAGLQDMHLL
jgi:hypothetical protein